MPTLVDNLVPDVETFLTPKIKSFEMGDVADFDKPADINSDHYEMPDIKKMTLKRRPIYIPDDDNLFADGMKNMEK